MKWGLVLLCACATSHKLDEHVAAKTLDEEHAVAAGEEHKGPTWVWEFAPVKAEPPDFSEGSGSAEVAAPRRAPNSLPAHGPLVKLTYTGPVDTSWMNTSDGLHGAEASTDLKKDDESEPSRGCALGLGLWGALSLAGALTLAYRFRAPIWAVCKRMAGIP